MSLATSFPNSAFSYGFGPEVYTGNRFYVSSTAVNASDGNTGLRPETPLATLDFAFSQCTADNGDVIYVMPKHAETITGAAGIAHDVAGVSVNGLGHGGQRPTFLMDGGTAVTYKITANDALVRNLVFNSGHASVVTCIDVQIATDAWIDNCEFGNNTTTEMFVTCIKSGTTTNNQCDGLKVTNCTWFDIETTALEFIEILGNTDRVYVEGNFVRTAGTGLAALVVGTAGDILTQAYIVGNILFNNDAADAVTIYSNDGTTNTGVIARNFAKTLDIAGEVLHTASNTGMFAFENYSTSVATVSGYLLPVKDS